MLLLNIAISYCAQSKVITALACILLVYLLIRLVVRLYAEVRLAYWHRKIPGVRCKSLLSQIVGAPFFDFYLSVAHIISIEKFFTQTLLGMSQLESSKSGINRVRFGLKRYVNLYRADTVEPLITSLVNISKSDQYNYFEPWLGSGLLTSTGDKWRRTRKLLTPAFHFKILDSFTPIMNENAQKLINRIDGEEKKELDIRQFIADCTLDIICETAMGVSMGAQSGNVEYADPLNILQNLVMTRTLNPLFQSDFIYGLTSHGRAYQENLRKVNRFIEKVILERRSEFEQAIAEQKVDVKQLANDDLEGISKNRYAFLDSLLITHFQNPTEFTDENIKDEVNTFMFEGHDTTATSLIFSLLLIAGDERVQEKVYQEVEQVLSKDTSAPITMDDCRQLRYLEMVIKESLRLYPSVPFIGRENEQDFTVNGYLIPAGCTCLIYIDLLNKDPQIFPQPQKFIPERFEPNSPFQQANSSPYAYMPFSAGPRNCIGQRFAMLEMKTILASLIRKYRLTALTKRDTVDVAFVVLLKTYSPVCIRFEERALNCTASTVGQDSVAKK